MAECSSSTQYRGLGTLGTLPPEIRGMVYALLFCTGHTALARVSKAMYEDTKSDLLQHGIYHMAIEYLSVPRSYSWKVIRKPTQTVLPRIRNLDVCVKYGRHGEMNGVTAIRNPGSSSKDDEITSIFHATWKSNIDDPNSIFHKIDTATVRDSAVLSLQSQSPTSLLRQLVDHMEEPRRCFFKCEILQSTTDEMASAVFDSIELLRRFPYVATEFSYGPYHNRRSAELRIEDFPRVVAINTANTKRALGLGEENDQPPELKIIHRLCYFVIGGPGNLSEPGVKFWGDEPEDKDCGLGEWTEALGRVWPPKPA